MSRFHRQAVFPSLALLAALAACGGGEDASLGGTLSGLPNGAQIVLQNNGSGALTLTANGSFSFAGTLSKGASYNVTVLTQPAGSACSVINGAGTIDAEGTDVSNISVTCAANASIVGTVSGLASGTAVTLSNGGLSLIVGLNGAFAFPGILPVGTAYNVTVSTQPLTQSCSVSGGTGTVLSNALTNILVTCN